MMLVGYRRTATYLGVTVSELQKIIETSAPVALRIRFTSRGKFYCMSEDADRYMQACSATGKDGFMFQTGFVLREAVESAKRWKRIAKALHSKYSGHAKLQDERAREHTPGPS